MKLVAHPRPLFALLLAGFLLIGAGCNRANREGGIEVPLPLPQESISATTTGIRDQSLAVSNKAPIDKKQFNGPFGNPFDTTDSFVKALEAEDADGALEFIGSSVRRTYEKLFQDIDLKALAADLRDHPITPLRVGERYAEFLRVGTATGEVRYYSMTMHVEGNEWKIVGL